MLKGTSAFPPEQIDRQLARIDDSALIGPGRGDRAGLTALFGAGADFLLLRVNFDFADRAALRDQIARKLLNTAFEPVLGLDAGRAPIRYAPARSPIPVIPAKQGLFLRFLTVSYGFGCPEADVPKVRK